MLASASLLPDSATLDVESLTQATVLPFLGPPQPATARATHRKPESSRCRPRTATSCPPARPAPRPQPPTSQPSPKYKHPPTQAPAHMPPPRPPARAPAHQEVRGDHTHGGVCPFNRGTLLGVGWGAWSLAAVVGAGRGPPPTEALGPAHVRARGHLRRRGGGRCEVRGWYSGFGDVIAM